MVTSVTAPTGAVTPPVIDVTRYDELSCPCPFDAGQVTVAVPPGFAVACTEAGASGTSAVGVTGGAAARGPAPCEFTAYTVNRYDCPLVRPVISTDRCEAPTTICCPLPSTTYRVTG